MPSLSPMTILPLRLFVPTLATAVPFLTRRIPDINYAASGINHFPDPSILQVDGVWYAYATTYGGNNVQIATSTDYATWTHLDSDGLPAVGAWADQGAPAVWAPDVVVNDYGGYVLYYSAKLPDAALHCVGAAAADSPEGPFSAFDEVFACPTAQGGAIDADGFQDSDGTRYVVYKMDGNAIGNGGNCGNSVEPIVATPIMLQKVSGDGHSKSGDAVQILDRGEADGPLVEAPSLMRSDDGKYVLFFSSNCYSSEWYDISYAMADSVSGPYTKSGPFAVTGTSGLYAPGGLDVATDGTHVSFHAGNINTEGRAMYTAQITIDSGGLWVYTI
ncbi:glycoside hydrolase family 43 protein [Zalerion maritima]|uniref:Endo-1,5-alpha-L-arabinanase A n=1 Tax=Zalerion maritima TaxID=339359 RepID=A0AAD5WQZ4_9PEZI|nr:glycoside hydrolase family 43 protein [Zalerion maritima]